MSSIDINRVILSGHLTRDPHKKVVKSGTTLAEFGLAINGRRRTVAGESVEEATFVEITMWGRVAEIANEHLCKGAAVLIEGRLQLDRWDQDGEHRSRLRVVGERLQMLGAKSNRIETTGNPSTAADDHPARLANRGF